MPVVAMQVTSKTAHERTDQLFIYTFESPEHGQRTIVANLTNVYEVGDVAAIALEGTFLPGVEIKPRKVFGIPSTGMALGKVDDALDSELSARFDADVAPRSFRVTIEVEVEARYAEDCDKIARKAIKGGQGAVISAEPG